MEIRLNKFISDSGFCSRREADKYIELGRVFVNGKRAKIGDSVNKTDKVIVSGLIVEPKEKEDSVLLAFNKPRGIVSTTNKTDRNNIVDYINYHERIFPIGRLDKDSQGLILLTNDGDIVNKILRARNKHEKEYVVTVNKPVTDDFAQKMRSGVPILGEVTKKCKVEKISEFMFRIILVQGLNRQIRRMCEYFGYNVEKLERVRIMNVSLKGIGLGEWRFLNEQEMKDLKADIAHSSNENMKQNSTKKISRTAYNESFVSSNAGSKKTQSKRNNGFNPKARELREKGRSRKSLIGQHKKR